MLSTKLHRGPERPRYPNPPEVAAVVRDASPAQARLLEDYAAERERLAALGLRGARIAHVRPDTNVAAALAYVTLAIGHAIMELARAERCGGSLRCERGELVYADPPARVISLADYLERRREAHAHAMGGA